MNMKEQAEKKQMSIGGFLGLLFGIIALACILVMALVIIVDPFFQYHAPLKNFPYLIDDQLSQNPGLARNTAYNAVSLGSSVTTDYHVTWFQDLFGLDVVKLPYNGAYPRDIANAVEQADRSKNDIQAIFIGVDIAGYTADPNETKYPLPEYLYDKNPFNDVSYWFNKDVLMKYVFNKALLHADQNGTDPLDYYSNYAYLTYSEEHVRSVVKIPETRKEMAPADTVREPFEKNWEVILKPMIESHPETTFYFYFPPRSILYWYIQLQNGSLDSLLYEEKLFTEHLLAYENVEVHFLQNDAETILDLSHYTDETHFDQGISYKVLQWIKEGTYKATKDNYEAYLSDLKALTESYEP